MYQRGDILPSGSRLIMLNGDLQFDSTDIGGSKTDSISIRNDGVNDLLIHWTKSTESCFAISPPLLTIAPAKTENVYVTFAPTGVGQRIGKIVFHHNDLENSPFCVGVSGAGIGQSVSVEYQPGWDLVSLPVLNETIYQHPSMYAYLNGYISKDTMEVGEGYWAKPDSQFIYTGGFVLVDTIAVAERWNIIGSLSVPIPTSDVESIPLGIIQSPFYTFTGTGYAHADTLHPGRGYWVKVSQDGQLILAKSP
jgi:hypothetical protein